MGRETSEIWGSTRDGGITKWERILRSDCDQCPPETMLLVLAHLQSTYGGVKGYMQTIGRSPEQMDQLRARLMV